MSNDLAQGVSNTPELLEASALVGNTINTVQQVGADGKFDPIGSDLQPIVGWLLGSVAGVRGAGIAFGPELTNAGVPELIQNETAFANELDLASPIQKHNFTRIWGGILSAINEIKRTGVAEGRAQLIAEMQAGIVTFDMVVSGRVK